MWAYKGMHIPLKTVWCITCMLIVHREHPWSIFLNNHPIILRNGKTVSAGKKKGFRLNLCQGIKYYITLKMKKNHLQCTCTSISVYEAQRHDRSSKFSLWIILD